MHKLSKFSDNCDNDNDGYNNDKENIDGNYDNNNDDENGDNNDNDDNNNRSLDNFAQAVPSSPITATLQTKNPLSAPRSLLICTLLIFRSDYLWCMENGIL